MRIRQMVFVLVVSAAGFVITGCERTDNQTLSSEADEPNYRQGQQLVKQGRIGEIPQEDIAASVREALRLTYGRQLGNSGFDEFWRAFNKVQSLGGYNPFPPIPFVRFMADAMKWQFEHSPFGAARLLSKSERAALGPKGNLEVASRALAGSTMLYAAYLLRNSSSGGSNWYSAKVPGTDQSVDLIISNCVINLAPAKPRVRAEAMRVLRPGGRIVVSDLVLTRSLPDDVRRSVEAYVGCVAGAMPQEEFLAAMRNAGFEDVEILEQRGYATGGTADQPEISADAWSAVRSIKVRGVKPRH